MKRILENLHTIEGIQGSLVIDGSGHILAYQAHALYDLALLEQVGKTIVSTADAIRLLQEDWDGVSAGFSEGTLILRNLKPSGAASGSTYILAVIADSRLNAAFSSVAIRVATSKLKAMIESPGFGQNAGSSPSAAAPASSGGPPAAAQIGSSRGTMAAVAPANNDPGTSGLSWSSLGSTMGASSEIPVADPKSSAFLTACTKALAAYVGPMAKIFVKESVRQVCPDRPFSRANAEALIAALSAHIETAAGATEFQKKARALV